MSYQLDFEKARKEVRRLRMLKAIEEAGGAWKDKDHPELMHGAAQHVANLRRENEKRFERVTRR